MKRTPFWPDLRARVVDSVRLVTGLSKEQVERALNHWEHGVWKENLGCLKGFTDPHQHRQVNERLCPGCTARMLYAYFEAVQQTVAVGLGELPERPPPGPIPE